MSNDLCPALTKEQILIEIAKHEEIIKNFKDLLRIKAITNVELKFQYTYVDDIHSVYVDRQLISSNKTWRLFRKGVNEEFKFSLDAVEPSKWNKHSQYLHFSTQEDNDQYYIIKQALHWFITMQLEALRTSHGIV